MLFGQQCWPEDGEFRYFSSDQLQLLHFHNKQYILQQASTEQALHEPQPQAEVEHVELSN